MSQEDEERARRRGARARRPGELSGDSDTISGRGRHQQRGWRVLLALSCLGRRARRPPLAGGAQDGADGGEPEDDVGLTLFSIFQVSSPLSQ